MQRLTPDALLAIENDLARHLIAEFKLDLNCLLYDATNFHTYINTLTNCPIAQRGHNKQKRNDLRQVSLGMMTTADFNIPLLHMVYGGNITDAPQFGSVIDELIRRYHSLSSACPHITLVFDKGNNSEDNLQKLPRTGFHFVGSLRSNQCADLLSIPLRRFASLVGDDLQDVQAFRVRRSVFGAERTVLITFNSNLLNGQLQGISRNLAKTRADLNDIQRQLQRWASGIIRHGRKPTRDGIQTKVNKILTREYMGQLVNVSINQNHKHLRLRYAVNPSALARLSRTVLGKTILFTDNHEWSDEQIIHAYRAQYHIEHGFRDLKNPFCLGWNPRFHWTEHHIRVHAFYCVLALTLVSLLRRELAAQGLCFSAERLIRELSTITENLIVYPDYGPSKPRAAYALSALSPAQNQLVSLLKLRQFQAV
jgi:transposase